MSKLEAKIRQIVLKEMSEAPIVKNPQTEKMRLIAQSISAAKTLIKEMQSELPEESGMEAILANTLKYMELTQRSFLQIKSYIK